MNVSKALENAHEQRMRNGGFPTVAEHFGYYGESKKQFRLPSFLIVIASVIGFFLMTLIGPAVIFSGKSVLLILIGIIITAVGGWWFFLGIR